MTTKTDNHAEEQAAAQYSSIVRMLAALTCDYDRLTELKDEREELTEAVKDAEAEYHDADETNLAETTDALNEAREALTKWETDNAEELAELEDAAGDCTDEDAARDNIQEDPLEVQVRSDWTNPGETLEAGEFMILLCTGGPAVRIVGELDRGTPCRAWLEYQDWGTPWTQWFGAKSDTLCEYAANFFFGE
jgi:seryl-tRNA synthetase